MEYCCKKVYMDPTNAVKVVDAKKDDAKKEDPYEEDAKKEDA